MCASPWRWTQGECATCAKVSTAMPRLQLLPVLAVLVSPTAVWKGLEELLISPKLLGHKKPKTVSSCVWCDVGLFCFSHVPFPFLFLLLSFFSPLLCPQAALGRPRRLQPPSARAGLTSVSEWDIEGSIFQVAIFTRTRERSVSVSERKMCSPEKKNKSACKERSRERAH